MSHLLGANLLTLFLLQVVSGLVLALQFGSGIHSWETVNYGMSCGYLGVLKNMHAGMPVIVFAVMYAHIAGKLVKSVGAGQTSTMASGVLILVVSYATAFLGYAMVFGDMGYWATTVIFQLLSFVPGLVESLFGNFTLDAGVVTKLFTLHYLLGLLMAVLMVLHILVLHTAGSLSLAGKKDVAFVDTLGKDAVWVTLTLVVTGMLLLGGWVELVAGSNDLVVDVSVTPAHITPEAYLLAVYGALKVCAAKAAGILAAAVLLTLLLGNTAGYSGCGTHANALTVFVLAVANPVIWFLVWANVLLGILWHSSNTHGGGAATQATTGNWAFLGAVLIASELLLLLSFAVATVALHAGDAGACGAVDTQGCGSIANDAVVLKLSVVTVLLLAVGVLSTTHAALNVLPGLCWTVPAAMAVFGFFLLNDCLVLVGADGGSMGTGLAVLQCVHGVHVLGAIVVSVMIYVTDVIATVSGAEMTAALEVVAANKPVIVKALKVLKCVFGAVNGGQGDDSDSGSPSSGSSGSPSSDSGWCGLSFGGFGGDSATSSGQQNAGSGGGLSLGNIFNTEEAQGLETKGDLTPGKAAGTIKDNYDSDIKDNPGAGKKVLDKYTSLFKSSSKLHAENALNNGDVSSNLNVAAPQFSKAHTMWQMELAVAEASPFKSVDPYKHVQHLAKYGTHLDKKALLMEEMLQKAP